MDDVIELALVRLFLKIDTGGPTVEDGRWKDDKNGLRVRGVSGSSVPPNRTFGFRIFKPLTCVGDSVGASEADDTDVLPPPTEIRYL